MHSCCSGEIHEPRVATAFGGLNLDGTRCVGELRARRPARWRLVAVGLRPCATTHLRQVKKFWGVLFQAQIYSKRGLSLVHVAFRTRAFEYLD